MFLALVSLSRCGAVAWCDCAAALLPHKVVLQALSLITRQSAFQTFLSLNSHYENDGFHCTALEGRWSSTDYEDQFYFCGKHILRQIKRSRFFGVTWISNKQKNSEGDSIYKLVNTYILFCVKCLIDSFGLYASFISMKFECSSVVFSYLICLIILL